MGETGGSDDFGQGLECCGVEAFDPLGLVVDMKGVGQPRILGGGHRLDSGWCGNAAPGCSRAPT